MATVQSICQLIEGVAPLALQEGYDNAGLQVGRAQMEVRGVLLCIDVTEAVVAEAVAKGCNLIVSHHPLLFGGLKRLTGQSEVQRCVMEAVKHDIAIYAAHTNLDNVLPGVNGKIAEKIGLRHVRILRPMTDALLKLVTYVPTAQADDVRRALFQAGAGCIGRYDACSYNVDGVGTFRPGVGTRPFAGTPGELHREAETRVEVILPRHLMPQVVAALQTAHPYEEPAFDLLPLANDWQQAGAGIVGELPEAEPEKAFLLRLKDVFHVPAIRHTSWLDKPVRRVAVCGGAGSGFLRDALHVGADVFISGDFKYHEFFAAEGRILIADIGHYESEQFTKDIFYEIIRKKMPNFAIQISDINTNPINYL